MHTPGHHRLWVNGIHHGDISLNNLMYNSSPTGEPEGVLNDYDLASWKKYSTANSARIGTIPFMSLSMLNDGLENRIPRLYRHDAESFIWVLAYVTTINVEYKSSSVKISRPQLINPWFAGDPLRHTTAKYAFPGLYGCLVPVTKPHKRYINTIRSLVDYWVQLDCVSYESKSAEPIEPENDDPRGALGDMVRGVEAKLGADAQREFAKIKALLLETIGVSEVV